MKKYIAPEINCVVMSPANIISTSSPLGLSPTGSIGSGNQILSPDRDLDDDDDL